MSLIGEFKLEPPTNRDYFSTFIESPLYELLRNSNFTSLASLNKYLIETIPEDAANPEGFTIRDEGFAHINEKQINLIVQMLNTTNGKVKVIYES